MGYKIDWKDFVPVVDDDVRKIKALPNCFGREIKMEVSVCAGQDNSSLSSWQRGVSSVWVLSQWTDDELKVCKLITITSVVTVDTAMRTAAIYIDRIPAG